MEFFLPEPVGNLTAPALMNGCQCLVPRNGQLDLLVSEVYNLKKVFGVAATLAVIPTARQLWEDTKQIEAV